jgi:hypothetical protein
MSNRHNELAGWMASQAAFQAPTATQCLRHALQSRDTGLIAQRGCIEAVPDEPGDTMQHMESFCSLQQQVERAVRNTPNGPPLDTAAVGTHCKASRRVTLEPKRMTSGEIWCTRRSFVFHAGLAIRSGIVHLAGLSQEEAQATSRSWSVDGRSARSLGAMPFPIAHVAGQHSSAYTQLKLWTIRICTTTVRCAFEACVNTAV